MVKNNILSKKRAIECIHSLSATPTPFKELLEQIYGKYNESVMSNFNRDLFPLLREIIIIERTSIPSLSGKMAKNQRKKAIVELKIYGP